MRTINRRNFLAATSAATLAGCASLGVQTSRRRPNVVLVMSDDQGYGDLACHGNPAVKTPNLDRLYGESTRFTRFHVMPVCSPTRACLMTGRYNYRTGAVDTYQGRSMMYPDETTIAELLRDRGYRTGIFGKWHLGDNFPLRAIDQGFEEALVHRGGGLSQPSDPPGSGYFDPVLQHNGEQKQYKGYCTDVFTTAAMDFVSEHRDEPFFCYLATNAPHTPLLVDESYARPYLDAGIDENLAKYFGMITNFDDNMGRLLAHLDELGLSENTLLIFLTDNGSQVGHTFFNAGMRGHKGTVYEGGLRVPFFIRWPGKVRAGENVEINAAHIDVLPTILAACGYDTPSTLTIDGRSLLPLATASDTAQWPERDLFFQWHRGDVPEAFRASAVLSGNYKLIDGKELYNLDHDPGEEHDIAAKHPDVMEKLRQSYTAWFKDVSSSHGYDPPRIELGTSHENPSTLTRQDWRGAEGWGDKDVGYWEVQIATPGRYQIACDFSPVDGLSRLTVRLGGKETHQDLPTGAANAAIELNEVASGPCRLEAYVQTERGKRGARYVHVQHR